MDVWGLWPARLKVHGWCLIPIFYYYLVFLWFKRFGMKTLHNKIPSSSTVLVLQQKTQRPIFQNLDQKPKPSGCLVDISLSLSVSNATTHKFPTETKHLARRMYIQVDNINITASFWFWLTKFCVILPHDFY